MQHTMFIGLDVHKATISVVRGERCARFSIGGDPASPRGGVIE